MVRERIREFFLQPSPYYTIGTAARLLGVAIAALKREAEDDRREEYRSGGTWRFTWRQVAYVAFRTWTLAEIHEALGADAGRVLPPLLAMRGGQDLRIRNRSAVNQHIN